MYTCSTHLRPDHIDDGTHLSRDKPRNVHGAKKQRRETDTYIVSREPQNWLQWQKNSEQITARDEEDDDDDEEDDDDAVDDDVLGNYDREGK